MLRPTLALALGSRALQRLAPAQGLGISQRRPHQATLPPASEQLEGQNWLPLDAELVPESLVEAARLDPFRIPATADREGYHEDRHLDYWISGLHDYELLRQTAGRFGLELDPSSVLLDLGSASGRVARHAVTRGGHTTWALDINAAHVAWMAEHLDHSELRAVHHPALPHLPLADRSVNFAYGLSVFTHIDEFESAWLAELNRVLAPGGMAALSVHTERTWANLNPDWTLHESLVVRRRQIVGRRVEADTFDAPMPVGREVFRWRAGGLYNTNVFHHTQVLRRDWGRLFEVLEILPEASGYQDLALLRKPH